MLFAFRYLSFASRDRVCLPLVVNNQEARSKKQEAKFRKR